MRPPVQFFVIVNSKNVQEKREQIYLTTIVMTNLTVVIWSAGTPSPPTISIRILLKSTNILFCKMLLENYKNKPIKGAAIAQRFYCGPVFESQALHLLYYIEKRTKINKKRPDLAHILRKKTISRGQNRV